MEKFLDQFGLDGMQRVRFEQFVFDMADKMVGGYYGGFWETQEVNGVHMLLIPQKDTATPVQLKAFEYGGDMFAQDIETDHATASATFTTMVTTWFWNMHASRLTDAQHEKFGHVHEVIGNAVYKKGAGFDAVAYSRYTD